MIATSFATVMYAALIPVADSVGTDFKPAIRATRWFTGTVVGRLGGTKTYLPCPLRPPHRGGRECYKFAVVGASHAPWSR
jgi:hypothetical protein